MKMRSYNLLYLVLFTFTFANLISCADDEHIYIAETVHDSPCKVKANVYAVRTQFDSSFLDTRTGSLSTVWNDSAVIYLLFTRANGTTTTGQAVYSEDNDEWTVTYHQSLVRNEQMKCVAYYFDGTILKEGNLVKLNSTNGVYVDSTATYIFPSNGTLNISCKLRPITSRIRFVGDECKDKLLIDGLMHYSGFSLDDFTLRLDSSQIGLDNYQEKDYIYGFWRSDVNQELSLSYNYCRFTNDFTGIGILQVGKSGKMDLPTKNNHNGWAMHTIPNDVIDLGLSVYWRKENLGIDIPENWSPVIPFEPGWYCRWGDPNAWNKENDYNCEQECIAGNIGFDAARKQYGVGYSIPTAKQWEELLNNCTVSFFVEPVGVYSLGFAMCYIKSKNGNQIILGLCGETDKPSRTEGQLPWGLFEGYYWTANRVKGEDPKCVEFGCYPNQTKIITKNPQRCLNIRPVYHKE